MAQVGSLERLYQSYKGKVEFLVVYVREAHPGSIVEVPIGDRKTELQMIGRTSTAEDRLTNLRKVMRLAHLTMPAVIDDNSGTVKQAYAGWPDRLYVVGVDGKISFKGAPGPMGFRGSGDRGLAEGERKVALTHVGSPDGCAHLLPSGPRRDRFRASQKGLPG
jgi:hypothetical protein